MNDDRTGGRRPPKSPGKGRRAAEDASNPQPPPDPAVPVDEPELFAPEQLRQETRRPTARPASPNLRPDRALPSRLGMVDALDPRAGRLFTPALHTKDGELVLPGFGALRPMPTPALPLALYDLGVGKVAEPRGRGAPLALRLWVEAVLCVPLEDREDNVPIVMEVPLRGLLAKLYPERRPSPAEYWPRLQGAVNALESQEARIPWQDPKTGKGGLWRVVNVSNIPRGPRALDDTVRLLVDLPPGAREGPVVSPNLGRWGVRAAAPYRALIGLAFRWWHPGVTRFPVRGGQHWVQQEDPAAYGDPLTNDEAVALCFPTSTRAQRRNLALKSWAVLRQLEAAKELRIVDGRVLPPLPAGQSVV